MEEIRDPLVLVYETLKQAIKKVHGKEFVVFDDFPNADEFKKKKRNAANISYVSGGIEKGLMREYIPHSFRKNNDGTYTVATETSRMDYIIQVSFFADKKGIAQRLSTKFILYLEQLNELPLYNDTWNEVMGIFLAEPATPPEGDTDLWQCDQTWRCTGKLLTESIVSQVDINNFKPKVKNM